MGDFHAEKWGTTNYWLVYQRGRHPYLCKCVGEEDAQRIAAALNSVEGIATQSNAHAGVVDDETAVERLAAHMYRELCFMDFKYAGKKVRGKMLERARAALAAIKGETP